MEKTSIRRFRDEDAKAAAQVFFDSIHLGTQRHYNENQRRAWAADVPETAKWLDRLKSQTTFIAEQSDRVVGFMTVKPDGYIDLAFVAPDVIGKGVAKLLYASIEAEALKMGVRRLYSEASHLARAFFERQGWSVVREQTVSPRGVPMTNYVMEKILRGKTAQGHTR